jgi:alginate O-acetyltransferase complex protein AlgI
LLWAIFGVVLNLLVLGFFKYAGLFALSFSEWFGVGIRPGHWLVLLPLPIGISFYTFQGISLVVDVYRYGHEKNRAVFGMNHCRSFWEHYFKTVFFVCFFPQLVAGPIVKAHDFFPQIAYKRRSELRLEPALRYLILGYFLKIGVADNLQAQTFWIAYPYFLKFSSVELLALLFGFSMQIFADFAGYSLIAIGTARLFGYRLPANFNFPYIARSFSEFWRRWHISLSSWQKECLYFALGGRRRSSGRTYSNLFLVMFLGGLWHGAA